MTVTSRLAWPGHAGAPAPARPGVSARVRPLEEPRRHGAPAASLAHAVAADDSEFVISCITGEFGLAHWNGEWRRLLAASRSPEKIYQTPEFFRFLADSHTTRSDQFELYAIKHRASGKVVGMVPVRVSRLPFDFNFGARTLRACAPRIVRILGSVPLIPDDPALLHQLFACLLRSFPGCAAVSMQACPVELGPQLHADRRHAPMLLHGWRACHTIALPPDWPSYLARMGAKQRYNLGRQVRQLEQAAGPLQLERIDRSPQVRGLVAGIAALVPGTHEDGAHMGARDYRIMAANRLLLSYVLRSAGEVIAVVVGSRYGDTWHVHQIMYAPAWRHLSAGTVALHCALQDVTTDFAFATADLGYGTPRRRFASTHVLKTRAHVLVARRGSWPALLLGALVRLNAWHAACARMLRR